MQMTKVEASDGPARQRFDNLHDEIRKRICLLDYLPNTRLREEELAAEFGVSRTPLRRVLVRLESEGLLNAKHGVGTIVTDVDIKELKQVYQLRMELAELIGKLSPIPKETIDLDEYKCFLARCYNLIEKPDLREFSQLNMDFTHAVFRLTESMPLREISERLFYQTARIWVKSIPQLGLVEESKAVYREIDNVLEALSIGDLAAVGLIRRSHLSMGFTRLWELECG